MTNDLDILIRHAKTRHRQELVDVAIQGGKIAEIGPGNRRAAGVEIDAGAGLVTESFVNPHLHLDKVYTLNRLDEQALRDYHGQDMGKAMTAIELAARVKAEYKEDWIVDNARRAVRLAARYGTTHMRAFTDVDSQAQLVGIKALLQVREEWRGRVEIQVVAFPQDGVIREPGAEDLVRQALEMGADVVGGIPWIEYTDADSQAHVDAMFDLAVAYDKDVSMLVDDAGDPGLRTLEMMAVRAIRSGWKGRCLAHHARAMAMYPAPYVQKIAGLLKQAGMGLVTDPHTGPLHARVAELLDQDVIVCLGQDDISDAYYPFGRNNLLEVAFLASHLLWMTTRVDMDRLYDMITTQAAKAIGLSDFGLAVGAPANLVVLEAPDVLETLRDHAAPRYVISQGRLLEPEG
ncbi:MAG TPA: amidohydrolase family protein [Anaerolineales bacterium]|nr:amidohydrolase family protein [Anaerolineales bacterium]